MYLKDFLVSCKINWNGKEFSGCQIGQDTYTALDRSKLMLHIISIECRY